MSDRVHESAYPESQVTRPDGLVYITMGQKPEHGEGAGILWCVDPSKHVDGSDVSAELATDLEGNVLPHRRVKAVDRSKGERAAANPSSAVVWKYDKFRQNSDVAMNEGEPMKVMDMGNSVYMTPIVANNVLYVANRTHLFAIVEEEK